MSTNSNENKTFTDNTKLGEYAAQQPVSGVNVVSHPGAVVGHGAVVYSNEPANKDEPSAA